MRRFPTAPLVAGVLTAALAAAVFASVRDAADPTPPAPETERSTPAAARGEIEQVFIPYQGRLDQNGAPAEGVFDFRFRVLGSGPSIVILQELELDDVPVEGGLFQVRLPIERDVLITSLTPSLTDRSLGVAVRPGDENGPYTALSPDQPIDVTPYAVEARTLAAPALIESVGSTDGAALLTLLSSAGTPSLEAIGNAGDVLINGSSFKTIDVTSSGGRAIEARQVGTASDSGVIVGINEVEPGRGVGVGGNGGWIGVKGRGRAVDLPGSGQVFGVYGTVSGTAQPNSNLVGVHGRVANSFPSTTNFGLYGDARTNSGRAVALYTYAEETGNSGEAKAAVLNGNALIDGQLEREFVAGQPKPALPAAWGHVASNGSVTGGSGNVAATWNAALSRYELTVDDQALVFGRTTSIITPTAAGVPRIATTAPLGTALAIYIYDLSGAPVANSFSFVIYDSADTDAATTAPGMPSVADELRLFDFGSRGDEGATP